MLTPFPGTLDFAEWEKSLGADPPKIDGIPITRHWLIPQAKRPKVYMPHPVMSRRRDPRPHAGSMGRFYTLPSIWKRSPKP